MKFGQGLYGVGKFQPEVIALIENEWSTVIDNAGTFTNTPSTPSNTWTTVT